MTDMPSPDSDSQGPTGRLDRLRARVQDGPSIHPEASSTERADDFVAWWLMAARLATLGDDATFRTWPRVAGQLGIDAVAAMAHAARRAVHVLGDGVGEPLAEAIIDAEDAGCLVAAEGASTGLLPELRPIVEAWVRAAADAVPDEEAAEILRDHAEAFPLPSPSRLPAVGTPLTSVELLAAAALAPVFRPTRLAPVFEFEETLALFDDGRPTETMRRRFGERRGEAVTPGDASMEVATQLDEFWGVVVRISGDAARLVRSVRLGTRPLRRIEVDEADATDGSGPVPSEPVPSEPVLFETLLAELPLAERLRLLRSDIGITTGDGGRFLA